MQVLTPHLSVCFFSHSSQLGGAERSLLELITELIRDHGTVCSVVLPETGPLKEKLEQAGALTLIVDYSWWCDWDLPSVEEINTRLFHSMKVILERVSPELIKIHPDIIFTNTMVIPWGAVTASLLRKPHVWFIHEFGKLDYNFKFFLPFQRILQIITDSSNLVLTNSDAVKQKLFDKADYGNVVTIPQHIDIPADTFGREQGCYFTKGSATKLIVSGIVTESKGQEDAILAVKELVQRKRDVELIILGATFPWYLRELKKIVRDENLTEHVKFHEFSENPYRVINESDIVLVCSQNEAFGRVTLEAMLLKKAVIGTNSGGTVELVRDRQSGLLYTPGDYRQLADQIEYLIEHKDKCREFGERGFELATTAFTKEKYGGEVHNRLIELKNMASLASTPFFSFVNEHLLNLALAGDVQLKHLTAEQEHMRGEVDQLTAEREELLQEAAERHALIKDQGAFLQEITQQLTQLTAEREALIQETNERHALMKDQEAFLEEIRRSLNEFQQSVHDDEIALAQKEEEIKTIAAELAHVRTGFEQKSLQLAERETDLLRIYQSHGWKALTLYYRVRNGLLPEESYQRLLAKKIFHFVVGFGSLISRLKFRSWQLTRAVYHHLPVSFERKERLKSFIFRRFDSLFKNTDTYRVWLQSQAGWLSEEPVTDSPHDSTPVDPKDLALPAAPMAPLVSIIIPVYNQLDFTLRCLKSIQENPSKASAEIIVLDDTSDDATPEVLPAIPGVRYIRNQANLGFLRSCNRAAAEARAEYLVFLNNDTEVQKDWLDNMLAVFDRDSHTGIVGAKLIYPSGRMQEAGSFIWSDGSAMNFGRDDDPRKPEYNYLRETDYCSAACMLIKASLFQEVNGFDEIFSPAYYEDTDLALKVRQKGYKVIYQPAARVRHFEGGTCGIDLNSGVKSYQQVNAKKFAAKWARVLPEHYPPQNQDLVLTRDRRVVGRCLIVDYWPLPDQDSGSIDLINKIKLFQKLCYKVTFFPYTTMRHYGRYTEHLQQLGVECLYEPFITTLADYLEQNGRYFDVAILCRAPCAISHFETVRTHCPNTKIMFDTVDLHFLRQERAAQVKNSDADLEAAWQMKREELDIAKKASCTLVVSQAEALLLKQEIPEASVEWFPFARDIPGRAKGFDTRRNIAFIGGYSHEPNVDAVTYFVKEIWPYIVGRLDHVQFLIVGSNMPMSLHLLADDRIRAIGYVEDLTQFLENCRLTVAPLRYGAGIKGKIATSLAHGVPVIASPVAAEGMGCGHGVHLLVAETIPQWVDCVVKAYTDETLWRNLSDNGQALMRESFSMEAALPRLRSLLNRLGCPLPQESQNGGNGILSSSDSFNRADDPQVLADVGIDEDQQKTSTEAGEIRAIAFYLPQYHPIPENDRWWGKGFTEWTYVTRAQALFRDHYQPQLPSELGFYDLRLQEVREAQADLAREHGISGFCYHYYWFRGQRLLERPLSEMLVSGRPDFPFCLCWANENWTRRWDGREQEILIKQEYSSEADLAFIQELFPVLTDRRYIRVNGKPLLLVYRTESLPNPKETAEIWREESIRAGIGDLYLCRVESFSAVEPESIGFDAACQFPPLLIYAPELNPTLFLNGSNPAVFQGRMFDYRGLRWQAVNSKVDYRRFFGVCPSWDNTPRRGNQGYMWLNSSPEEYEKWLVQAVNNTARLYRGEERLIFINAWNEWGEGCHLEPDQRYGRAYLQATRRSLGTSGKTSVSATTETSDRPQHRSGSVF